MAHEAKFTGSAASAAPTPRLKQLAAYALGILAGIGGFIDTGGIITATQAGARFQFALVWTVVFGFIGFAVFGEMSARIAVSSSQPTYEAIRTSLGPRLAAIPVIANIVVHVLTLAVDLVGMALALQMLTGVAYRIWLPAIAIGLAAALWRFSFTRIDTGAAIFGLTMLIAVAAMLALHPQWKELGMSLVHPDIDPSWSKAGYLFAIASMLGSFMTPYQFDFYSSGAIEEGWTGRDLRQNRIVSVVGTLFGALITLALMSAAGMVLSPDAPVETLRIAAQPTVAAFGKAGLYVFFIGVFCVSLAASVELCLSGGYSICQYYGWDWGKTGPAKDAPAFTLIYLGMIAIAAVIDLTGVDPIAFTVLTMALASAALPFTFIPLLLIANDRQFMGEQRNTPAMNAVAVLIIAVLVCITLATIPLLVLTHGTF